MAFFSKKKDEQIEVTDLNLPSHIGIIMDGNGRWAKKRGLPRKAGHRQGAKTFRTNNKILFRYRNKVPYRICFFNRKLEKTAGGS